MPSVTRAFSPPITDDVPPPVNPIPHAGEESAFYRKEEKKQIPRVARNDS